jgi:threonine/homoserine/homoserine lactone efflux protein
MHIGKTLVSTMRMSYWYAFVAKNPFLEGVTTEVLNPKTALFFWCRSSPQFVHRDVGNVFWQFLLLAAPPWP